MGKNKSSTAPAPDANVVAAQLDELRRLRQESLAAVRAINSKHLKYRTEGLPTPVPVDYVGDMKLSADKYAVFDDFAVGVRSMYYQAARIAQQEVIEAQRCLDLMESLTINHDKSTSSKKKHKSPTSNPSTTKKRPHSSQGSSSKKSPDVTLSRSASINPADFLAPKTDVAARVRVDDGSYLWALAVVVTAKEGGLTYSIKDADEDGKVHSVYSNDIYRLYCQPKPKPPTFRVGERVLALWPDATTFYPATVYAVPADDAAVEDRCYIVEFDGDDDPSQLTEAIPSCFVLPFDPCDHSSKRPPQVSGRLNSMDDDDF